MLLPLLLLLLITLLDPVAAWMYVMLLDTVW